jgi:hypothetical protein
MRKQFYLLAAAVLCIATAQAQNPGFSLRFNHGMRSSFNFEPRFSGVTADYNLTIGSFSGDLMGIFSLSEGKNIRLHGNYTRLNVKGDFSNDYGLGEYFNGNLNISQNSFGFGIGLSNSIASGEEYTFYTGVDLPVTIIGSTTFDSEFEEQFFDDFDSTFVKYNYGTEASMDGGFAVALAPFAGFSHTLFGPVGLGAEVSTGLLYSSIGSDLTFTYLEDGIISDTESADLKVSNLGLMPPKLSLILSYNF